MMPPGRSPFVESVMNARPPSPRRRSKRTSLRYVVSSATSAGTGIVRSIRPRSRSTQTSFAPPSIRGPSSIEPVSQQPQSSGRIHHDALHGDEAVAGALLVVDVDARVGIRHLLAVAQLGDGEIH